MGLIFLKTNNNALANRISAPNTYYLLDSIRPDILLLQILCKNLILWDSILPTNQWIQSQIPTVISEAIASNQANIVITQSHISIIAGSCFAIGLKFAGSLLKKPYLLLLEYLDYLVNLKKFINDDATSNILESCLTTIACSLSFIMAGSGDLKLLQIFRKLRQRVHNDLTYGNYMATHMAIGMLFLSGGKYSLSTDNMAIASLLISFYPQFPSFTSDNRYHLQALRHLYVLALEKRCIETLDIDTNESCMVQLDVLLKESSLFKETTIKLVSPCILPEFKHIKSIKISSPRYLEQTIEISNESSHSLFLKHQTIYIKRKAAFMSYSQDAKGDKSILSRSIPKYSLAFNSTFKERKQKNNNDFIQAFSADPNIMSFMNYFCNDIGNGTALPATFSQFSTSVLYECLTHDKLEALTAYFVLYTLTLNQKKRQNLLQNFELLLKFYSEYWKEQTLMISIPFQESVRVYCGYKNM